MLCHDLLCRYGTSPRNNEIKRSHLRIAGNYWIDCCCKFWSHDQNDYLESQAKDEVKEEATKEEEIIEVAS